MSHIFISYASSDRPRARVIAEALQHDGFSVWWDRKIPTGKSFDDVIQQNLTEAQCVIVLWSAASVRSDWVKEEASEGQARRILIPVLLDEVQLPIGFRRIQTANLVGWQGDANDERYVSLLQDIAALRVSRKLPITPGPLGQEQEKLSSSVSSNSKEQKNEQIKEDAPSLTFNDGTSPPIKKKRQRVLLIGLAAVVLMIALFKFLLPQAQRKTEHSQIANTDSSSLRPRYDSVNNGVADSKAEQGTQKAADTGSTTAPQENNVSVDPRAGWANNCDNLLLDLSEGLLNGVRPVEDPAKIKKYLPCWDSESKEEGAGGMNYGGGIFYDGFGFYFYTCLDFIEVRSNFTGKLSPDLLKASEAAMLQAFGKPFVVRAGEDKACKEYLYKRSFRHYPSGKGWLSFILCNGHVGKIRLYGKDYTIDVDNIFGEYHCK